MFKIDNTTAAAAAPAVPAAGVEGYFTGGDPATGTPATIVEAWFLNMIQAEGDNLVTGAGLARDKANNGQVYQAVKALVARGDDLAMSIAAPGYVTLPGGLILQWGEATADTVGVVSLFPIAFPTVVLAHFVTLHAIAAPTQFVGGAPTTTQITTYCNTATAGVRWLVIGH
ncbi:gp53-like domain-containing protein [Varunaivibrio sulfuroxidans]|uniref:Putative tail fiber protein gp53-like C-terminal domain-containing protein n=1 Tax=Varunaivibrio sulfuroxidans TaxID=1773489 RepID=A0A4R3JAK7_9PROT|nr:hypothetical protein [Varunaivibrio sulfuroxidans]TCS62597.1 hypothetical protein EDD55_105143 [Varunaivibrio sulfuroxidans]WES30734.1 hypothetical protein P3M64_14055 [Varunaivibrio sulfuroxidans]